MASGLRYWHTLRHLRPVQWYGRAWSLLWRPRLEEAAPAPNYRTREGVWQMSPGRTPSLVGADRFRFLNFEHRLPPKGGWNDDALEKLWLYNLHYFDDLNASGAGARAAWHQSLLQRWVAENPPTEGNGWEPYPTSLRIVNWVKWALSGHALPVECVQSLGVQARWLARRMEWHLLGNHLFANAKALVFAGLFFEGPAAHKWLGRGLHVIARELPEQVLLDGGNFERSTMYHSLFLEDLLDLINVSAVWPDKISPPVVAIWRSIAGRMLGWLEGMSHPDRQIALFNDAAFGIAPDPSELRQYAHRLGVRASAFESATRIGHRHWADSGYIRLYSPAAVALLDVAAVGPGYLPGHSHADTLSFELSVFGQRVIVNGGTSRYGLGPERARERSTSAHSTVEVSGENSSEVWSGFRVARRASPFDLEIKQRPCSVACSHNGYRRLPGRPVHRREWSMAVTGLTVTDMVNNTCAGPDHPAVARFILHPDVKIAPVDEQTWRIALKDGNPLTVTVGTGHGALEEALYACEFGKVVRTQCLKVELRNGRSVLAICWN